MGLIELFLSVLIVGLSAVNATVPLAAWSRTRDPRFVLVAAASMALLLLGLLWTWGQLPVNPPEFTAAELPALVAAAAAVLCLFGTVLLPRRAA